MPDPNPPPGPSAADPRELLSRLADGDCDGRVTPAACAHWESDAGLRQTWHRYHLIGDVLRSDDLSQAPARDADFLAELRRRLATEPAIVAPLPAAARTGRLQRWATPAAVAAGFVAVAGLVVVMRAQQATPAAGAVPVLASAGAVAPAGGPAVDAAMIRDARLDIYLQAHRDMRVNAAAAMPGGGLRNVDLLLAPR